jgi:predicted dehydrogenase
MNGAIVGFGVVACKGHWPAYAGSTDVQIVAVVDPRRERRALAEATIPGVQTYVSIAELPDHVEFVDVCTPPSLHADSVLAALDRRCHVLCEKPLVLRPSLLAPIRTRAVERGLAVVPAHNWKYAPILQRATGLLRSGAIGDLRRVEIVTMRTGAALPADSGSYNWRTDPLVAGGGILMDHGWHAIYLALHWFAETPTRIDADLRRPPAGGVEDEADLSLLFPTGEAHIALTWRGNSRLNTAKLIGTSGEILADDATLYLRSAAPRIEPMDAALSAGSHHADWFTAMLPDVVRCFRDPDRSRPLFDEASQCLSIIDEAYRRTQAKPLPQADCRR